MAYSHYDVAHRWMTGIGDSCKGSNMFFEGDSIYSYGYHFVIARKWRGVILWNDNTYSSSTSKHQSYVRSAAWGKIVHCAVLDRNAAPETEWFYKTNMNAWREMIEGIVKGPLAKARKPEIYYNQIQAIVDKAYALCEVIGRKLPKDFDKFMADNPDREELLKKMQEDAKKRAAAEERRRKREEKEKIERFLNFESNSCSSRYQIVRLRTDKNRFETSLGVQIPFEMGREFYDRLAAGQLRAGDKVLYYVVREVGKLVKVGCHTFERDYLLKYGKQVFA